MQLFTEVGHCLVGNAYYSFFTREEGVARNVVGISSLSRPDIGLSVATKPSFALRTRQSLNWQFAASRSFYDAADVAGRYLTARCARRRPRKICRRGICGRQREASRELRC